MFCKHCGNPDKASWQTSCRWFGKRREEIARECGEADADAFMQSGFDPPCAMDEYVTEMHRRERAETLWILLIVFVLPMLFIGGIFFLFI